MDKKLARSAYEEHVAALRAILNRHDPVGLIGLGCPEHEYDPERGTIAPKLMRCRSFDEVLDVVYAEFCAWFGGSAGPKSRYAKLAEDLWQLRNRYNERLASGP
jgi:hypothetical protein